MEPPLPTRLYLHIGTHKTGTTSFQRFCMDHREALRREGLSFFAGRRPRPKGGPIEIGNAWWLAHSFLRPELLTMMRFKSRTAENMLDIEAVNHERLRFRRFAQSTDTPGLLVSAEAFSLARTQSEASAISSFFGSFGLEITPVLVVRANLHWRQSYDAQMTRGGYAGDVVNGLPDVRRIDRDWVFDTQAIRDFWHGIGRLREVAYEEAVAQDGSVIPSLLRAVDLPGELGAEADYFFNSRETGTS